MAPERRRGRRSFRRWNRGHHGGRVDHAEDTIAGDPVRRVLDSYCPFCATDIRSLGPRRLIRCPNIAICGKILPIDDSCCPSCCHYTRPADNFCRVCRANLRGVVRGRGGLYQQLRRAPSPINNASPPRQAENAVEEFDEETDYEDEIDVEIFIPVVDDQQENDINQQQDGQLVGEPVENQQHEPVENQQHEPVEIQEHEPVENQEDEQIDAPGVPQNNARNEHYLFSRQELIQFGFLENRDG